MPEPRIRCILDKWNGMPALAEPQKVSKGVSEYEKKLLNAAEGERVCRPGRSALVSAPLAENHPVVQECLTGWQPSILAEGIGGIVLRPCGRCIPGWDRRRGPRGFARSRYPFSTRRCGEESPRILPWD